MTDQPRSPAGPPASRPIGLLSVTAAGAAAGRRLAAAWPGRTRAYPGPVRQALPRAFAECGQLVCFLASGATVRLLAPLLGDPDDPGDPGDSGDSGDPAEPSGPGAAVPKATGPGVVCVDEAGRHAVALLGGHAGGANALARAVAEVLPGCEPVITTGTDAAGVPGLDTLGWPVEGAVAAVGRAVLDGEPVALRADATWPLPALGASVTPCPEPADAPADEPAVLAVTDRAVPAGARTAVLRPPSLTVGVGASRGVSATEVRALITDALAAADLSPHSVTGLATVDAKADEAGLIEAAEQLGLPLVTHPAQRLAAVDVPHPSAHALRAVGTPSVAEAAALATAGPGSTLVVPKHTLTPTDRAAMATCAVARCRPRGRLTLIGLGPGARDLLTPRASEALRAASVVVGLDQYLTQVEDLLRPGTRVLSSGLGAEEERARAAVAEARAGHAVALLGSGDAGVYAMASPALAEAGDDIDVEGVPGVTAALAAAALLGAPLGHDHAMLSLSDLHTPWEVIERRVRAAAQGDLVVTFYNPRSRGRHWQLPRALSVLAEHRGPGTPVGVVRNASRPGQRVTVGTLGGFGPVLLDAVDMLSVVTVGNSATRLVAGRMVTPRGYRWQGAS